MSNILLDAFRLDPREAIEFLKKKGYEITWNWREMLEDAHARAFTVAGILKMDLLKDIREALIRALEEGRTLRDFQKEIEPILRKKGWWGYDPDSQRWMGTPWRLQTIFNTNVQSAYMAGRYSQMEQVKARRPYWQYLAVMDSKTRPSHAALHGKIFPADDPFWNSFYPPNGFNCRCHVRSLSKRQIERYGLKDKIERSGDDLTIKTVKVGDSTEKVASWRGISPDPGWSYNPGKSTWIPSLNDHPYDLARSFIADFLSGPLFKKFWDGRLQGNFPVAVIKESIMKAINSLGQVVLLSSETLSQNKARYPEITLDDYAKLQDIIDNPDFITKEQDKYLISLKLGDYFYHAVIKRTENGKELYLMSLMLTGEEDIEGILKRGELVFRREQ